MYDLQEVLDDRLASLKKQQIKGTQKVQVNDVSLEYIQHSLKQAGILDKQGKMKHLTS